MYRATLAGVCLLVGFLSIPTKAGCVMSVNLIRPDWICSGETQYFDQQYIGKYTTAPDSNPWNKQFLSDMSIYHCIRFMDWLQINNVYSVSWATRTQKNGPNQKIIAYEWMCDLCNRLNCDLWLNVYHMADSIYVTNLGQLVGRLLKPNLRVYLEYSNETWWENQCDGYTDCANPHCASVGNSIGINNQVKDSTGKTIYGRADWTGNCFLSAQMWRWFKLGWNTTGRDTNRCITVLGGQSGYGNAADAHYMLEALSNAKVNPSGQKCNAFAEAPYWEDGSTGDPLYYVPNLDSALQWTKPRGVSLVCYEGGHGNYDAIERPDHYDRYMTYLNALDTRLDGPFCQFAQIGTGCSVQWGAKSTTSESNETAPIYRALRDWSLAHPVAERARPFHALTPEAQSASSIHSLLNVKLYRPNGSKIGTMSELRGRSGCSIAIGPGREPYMVLNMHNRDK